MLKEAQKLMGDTITTSETTPSGRTKRARKSLTHFEPEDHVAAAAKKKGSKGSLDVPKGRGTALAGIPSIVSNVEKTKANDAILSKAYRLLYGGPGGILGRGKIPKVNKASFLEFSGYLPPLEKDMSAEEKELMEKREDELEERFATMAHQMTVPLLKALCDLFDISRIPAPGTKTVPGKEGLVDLLLDFLGAPHVKMTKSANQSNGSGSGSNGSNGTGGKKKRGPGRPRKKKPEEEEEEDEDVDMDMEDDEAEAEVVEESEDEDEVVDGVTLPSAKKLKKWVEAYVTCFSLEKATTNHAIETASDKFGVDLVCKKEKIKELLAEAMSE